jgi:hypothetical protein
MHRHHIARRDQRRDLCVGQAFIPRDQHGLVRCHYQQRLLEAWVLSLAMTPSGRRALDAGRLEAPAAAGLVAVGAALGVPPADMVSARKTLEAELARETPFRERFLSLLAHRASFARRPVLLLPLVWGRLGAVKVAFGPPACLLPAPRGRAALLGPDGALVETTAAGWARDFVEARFS